MIPKTRGIQQMLSLHQIIRSPQWNVEQAALQLGEPLAMIEALLQGEIEKRTIDQLITMLNRAGMYVRVEV